MKGKTCIVTGANSGIGKVIATELARMGGYVVMVCRDLGRGEAAIAEIKRDTGSEAIELMLADFSSLGAVRKLAEDYKKSHD